MEKSPHRCSETDLLIRFLPSRRDERAAVEQDLSLSNITTAARCVIAADFIAPMQFLPNGEGHRPFTNTYPIPHHSEQSLAEPTVEDAAAAKRRKVTRACDHCKSRKRRCTGECPCPNCVRQKVQCKQKSHVGSQPCPHRS